MSQMIQSYIPSRDKRFLFSKMSRMALGPPQPPFNGYLGYVLSSGVKRLELEDDNSPSSLIIVKNEWSSTFIPSVCLKSMKRDTYLISNNTCIICSYVVCME